MASFDKSSEEICNLCDNRGTEPQTTTIRQPRMGVLNPEVVQMLREGRGRMEMGRMERGRMEDVPAPSETLWMCISCGKTWKGGKFCAECGTPRPKEYEGWICSCGSRGRGAVCATCGAPRPADVCDPCGWKPAEGVPAPVYCPECGYVIQKEKVKPGKIPDYYWG